MKRKLPEKFFEQNQRAKTRKWKFFNLNQTLWGAGNREFRGKVRMFDQTWDAGDIVVAEPGDVTSFEALSDAVLAVIKTPGALNDKYLT